MSSIDSSELNWFGFIEFTPPSRCACLINDDKACRSLRTQSWPWASKTDGQRLASAPYRGDDRESGPVLSVLMQSLQFVSYFARTLRRVYR